jgi:hypothetical protein
MVTAANAAADNGGVALTNVRYQVWVNSFSGVKIVVPSAGSSIDGHGQPIAANSEVEFFSFKPADSDLCYLQAGESDSFLVTGVAPPGPTSFIVTARIQGDPDINIAGSGHRPA